MPGALRSYVAQLMNVGILERSSTRLIAAPVHGPIDRIGEPLTANKGCAMRAKLFSVYVRDSYCVGRGVCVFICQLLRGEPCIYSGGIC